MGMLAEEALGLAKSGRVLTLYAGDVSLGRRQLRVATEESEHIPTLVALEWEHAPSLARELDEMQTALADAAASLWPHWYTTAERRFERDRSPTQDVAKVVKEAKLSSASVSSSWLREAWERCRRGQRPIVRDMASAEQVGQLSRALDPSRLVLALSVEREEATSARLRGLANAAEWLAREARAKTLLLVPRSWQGRSELDHVSYGAAVLEPPDAPPDLPPEPPRTLHGSSRCEQVAGAGGPPEPSVTVGPVLGKPHPGSEVEQLVYACLRADAELGDLFQYNQKISAGDKSYIVDLVWRAGGLVVELDGTEHHSQLNYVKDRERDFRLYVNGFATLRIPNAEIFVSVEAAIQRIRTMVHYLKLRGETRSQ